MNTRQIPTWVYCGLGITMSVAFCCPVFADGGHTCPDYSQHEAVLKHGQDCIAPAPRLELKENTPPRMRRRFQFIPVDMSLQSYRRNYDLGLELKSLQTEKLTHSSITNERCWLAWIEQGVAFSIVPKEGTREFCETQTNSHDDDLTWLENRSILLFICPPNTGQFSGVAIRRLLGALSDWPENKSYFVDVNLLSNTLQASRRLNQECRSHEIFWKNSNYLFLAGMEAWFKQYDDAQSMLDKLSSNKNLRTTPYDADTIQALAIAINGRKEDWSRVQSYEQDCIVFKQSLASSTILNIYARHGRKDDLMRFFRECYKYESCCDEALKTIIESAHDNDRAQVSYAVRRRKTDDVYICAALSKKKLFEEAIAACVNYSGAISVTDSDTLVRLLHSNYPTQFEPRLILAAAVCFEWGNKKLGGDLLSNLSNVVPSQVNCVARAENYFNENCKLISLVSSITKSPDVSQVVEKRRELSLKRKELLECLALAEKLEETGNKLFLQGTYDEARAVYTSALDIRRKNLKSTDCLVANTLQNLAQTNMMLNEVDAGCRHFEECISIYKQINEREYLKGALQTYGSFLSHFGKPKEAESVYAESKRYTD